MTRKTNHDMSALPQIHFICISYVYLNIHANIDKILYPITYHFKKVSVGPQINRSRLLKCHEVSRLLLLTKVRCLFGEGANSKNYIMGEGFMGGMYTPIMKYFDF